MIAIELPPNYREFDSTPFVVVMATSATTTAGDYLTKRCRRIQEAHPISFSDLVEAARRDEPLERSGELYKAAEQALNRTSSVDDEWMKGLAKELARFND